MDTVDVILTGCRITFHAAETRRIFDESLEQGQDEVSKKLIDENPNLLKILQGNAHVRTLYTYLYAET